MRQWRLLYDMPMNGAANMAADEAILRAVAADEQPPTLRLYAWEPFCLSLGYGQRAADADLARLAANGWDLVRRPTGGRAILHGDELTYSVALPEAHPLARGGIIETYLRLSAALLQAMGKLGLNVYADPDGDTASPKGAVCFEVPSKYEITAHGKKLIGSAQMRRYDGVLQHGTLPLVGDIARICDALQYADDAERAAAKVVVRERAITLEGAGAAVFSWEAAAHALAESFAEVLEVEFVVGALSDAERVRAAQLYDEVYSAQAWNFKR